MIWPHDRTELLALGIARMSAFCLLNDLSVPKVTVIGKADWHYGPCAYYRPKTGIFICLEKCQVPCPVAECRNWTWPGSTTDREPYGVVGHELAHHMDWTASERKGTYHGDYSIGVRARAGEKPVTSYCDNDAEWFAEIGRIFVTNPALLRAVRPKSYAVICERWKPLPGDDWMEALGENVPERVIRAARNKIKG